MVALVEGRRACPDARHGSQGTPEDTMELIAQLVRDFVQQGLPADNASLVTANESLLWAAVGAAVWDFRGGD